MEKVVIGIEFDGSSFCGWQSQAQGSTIQDTVQTAVSKVAQEKVIVHAAGRTDTGVHATLMPAHFVSNTKRSPQVWMAAVNSFLPSSIRILWACCPSIEGFHARHSAYRRYYQYLLINRLQTSALFNRQVSYCNQSLSVEAMQDGSSYLLGRNDFSAFRSSSCQSPSAYKCLFSLNISSLQEYIVFTFCGDGFLHHMIRNIVGSLLWVGTRRQKPEWIAFLLEQQDRKLAAPTASPNGLYFIGADYPSNFQLPSTRALHPLTTTLCSFNRYDL